MNINKIIDMSKMFQEIQQLSGEADRLNELGKVNNDDYKLAAIKYQEVVTVYEKCLDLADKLELANKTVQLIKANMYHEKYDYNVCYGSYYSVTNRFEKTASFFKNATVDIKQATYYISELLKETLTDEENEAANYDYGKWSLDLLLIEAMKLSNEVNKNLYNGNYANAYDNTQMLIEVSQKVYCKVIGNEVCFTYEDRRKYKAQIEALHANLFSIQNLQSRKDYSEMPSHNLLIDRILYLTHSYEYTTKAIQINSFWSDYKIVRENIYHEIESIMSSCKKEWKSILLISNNNTVLIEIMNNLDSKYYKKITKQGGILNMRILKNIVKTKGNVVVNSGSNNIIMQTDARLSVEDKKNLEAYIHYLENSSKDKLPCEEYTSMIKCLDEIVRAETSAQEMEALNNWSCIKAKFSKNALNFLSVSADIVTLGPYLMRLLGI